MGSGSTLLRLILDSHDRIAIPQETGFMRAYQAHQFVPLKWSGRNWARRMGWSREELDAELAAFYDKIFTRYAQSLGKDRWGDKTPLHTWHVEGMARLFPDAVFVGIIRHPGGSVGSNMTRFGHAFPRAVRHVDKYDREIARQAAIQGDRFAVVRYEEMVLRPEALFRELLDWLGEPWSDRVLEHHTVQVERGGQLTVEGKNRIDDPIDVSRIDKWHRTMPGNRRPALKERLGRLAEFWGYSMDDPAVFEPLAADGGMVVHGRDVARRIDAFGDLDLRAEPEPPIAERFYHPGKMQLYFVEDGPPAAAAAAAPAPAAPEREPHVLVRAWRVLPRSVRVRLHPIARRAVRRVRGR